MAYLNGLYYLDPKYWVLDVLNDVIYVIVEFISFSQKYNAQYLMEYLFVQYLYLKMNDHLLFLISNQFVFQFLKDFNNDQMHMMKWF